MLNSEVNNYFSRNSPWLLPGKLLTAALFHSYLSKNDIITLAIYLVLFQSGMIQKMLLLFSSLFLSSIAVSWLSPPKLGKQSNPRHYLRSWCCSLGCLFLNFMLEYFRISAYSIIGKVRSYLSFWSWQVSWLPRNLSAIQT